MTQSYIIHLATSTARQPQVDALLAVLPNAQVVDAVDGRLLSDSERAVHYQRNLHTPTYPFPLLPGEIGCFLSHRKCWQEIVNSDAECGLVVEDDVALDMSVFGPALALAQSHCSADSFIRLPLTQLEPKARVVDTDGMCELFQPAQIGLTTAVQLVGRSAAARLLALTGTFDRPIDTFLQMNWITGIGVTTLFPNGVRSVAAQQGGSTIQKKKAWHEKLPREWQRWRYRAKIRVLAARNLANHRS